MHHVLASLKPMQEGIANFRIFEVHNQIECTFLTFRTRDTTMLEIPAAIQVSPILRL